MANDDTEKSGPLELRETLFIQTNDGAELPFEVVGILEDAENRTTYAVLMHEGEDEEERQFIVTDLSGDLLSDDAVAQEVLDEFLLFAEEAADAEDTGGTGNILNGSGGHSGSLN